jgi:hypothetical protein
LYKISSWASVEKFTQLASNTDQLHDTLQQLIDAFSKSWRGDKLPLINKLHLFEAHLADFIVMHNGWSCFGEQGLFTLIYYLFTSNFRNRSVASNGQHCGKSCFGQNQNIGLNFFMKV